MADTGNDNVSVSEARIDTSPGTGQSVLVDAEDAHSQQAAQRPQTWIDTSATIISANNTTTTTDKEPPSEAADMSNDSQTQLPPEQANAVPAEGNADVVDTEENVSATPSDRPPLRDEGSEQIRLEEENRAKPRQGNT